ncbi:MAG: FHA domain-containing protein, partial [Proteobacteria bacterium]|nr:FHA domain-containing protein [Pseudomonadota bacterium]
MAEKPKLTLTFEAKVGSTVTKHEFSDPSVTIGSGVDAMLRLKAEGVSTLHCVLNIDDDGTVQLLDLGAGTFHEGAKISSAKMQSGGVFKIGEAEVTITFGAAAAEPVVAFADEASTEPSVGEAEAIESEVEAAQEESEEPVIEEEAA